MELPAFQIIFPRDLGIGDVWMYGFHFDVSVVVAAIGNKIDFAAVGQQFWLVGYCTLKAFILREGFRHREFIDLFPKLTIS